jgi:DNA ligase-1
VRRFALLYQAIDSTTSTNAKVAAMASYFAEAPRADAAWALHFLSGGKIKRLVTGREVAEWAMSLSGVPAWLFEECYAIVGDLAETVTLLAAPTDVAASDDLPLSTWVEEKLLPLREYHAEMRAQVVMEWIRRLPPIEVFVLVKLLTGALRVGVSRTLVTRALAQAAGLDPVVIADRLMGDWRPSAAFMERLLVPGDGETSVSRPYPFFLASPLDEDPQSLGPRTDWLAEWKWDGIRAQIVRRAGQVFVWSRGEELITERFPEITQAAARLPSGCVIDGELLAFRDDKPLPFGVLQRRIGRQKLSPIVLAEAPATFLAFDLLEHEGEDIRRLALSVRRGRLEALLADARGRLRVSPALAAPDWESLARDRTGSRERGVEGIMLKRLDSPYGVGRERGPWWKWKIEPYTIDAVLVYAQPGHGRRANLLTDYTFAVRDADELVPVAKAYSGLSDEEIRTLDRWIRDNTIERFGPVRAVKPVHVFELAFEGIGPSPRHRSGIAVRFPRISRWRTDKTPEQADTLEQVQELMKAALSR